MLCFKTLRVFRFPGMKYLESLELSVRFSGALDTCGAVFSTEKRSLKYLFTNHSNPPGYRSQRF
jgi:hypothetical protein